MSTTQMVHFTLGTDAGKLLMTIAQEHLLYGKGPEQALRTFTESLVGCPHDIALDLLHGSRVLLVAEEEDGTQVFSVARRSGLTADFPNLNCLDFAKRHLFEIYDSGKGILAWLKVTQQHLQYGTLMPQLSYESVLRFIGGDEAGVLREITEDRKVGELIQVLSLTKAYVEKSFKILETLNFMKRSWPQDFEKPSNKKFFKSESREDYLDFFNFANSMDKAKDQLNKVNKALAAVIHLDYTEVTKEDESLERYVEAVKTIDKIAEVGIKPSNLMDNHSAGWLSPQGIYYALDGEIANMLHNQIASLLYEAGLIPSSDENESNPDNWLAANGWVKIHGNEILFEGNLNEYSQRGPNVFLTKVQVDMITDYCRIHYRGVARLTHQDVSALAFSRMAEGNPYKLYKDYFMGDLAEL